MLNMLNFITPEIIVQQNKNDEKLKLRADGAAFEIFKKKCRKALKRLFIYYQFMI